MKSSQIIFMSSKIMKMAPMRSKTPTTPPMAMPTMAPSDSPSSELEAACEVRKGGAACYLVVSYMNMSVHD